jgi:hypothetical protein
MSSAALLRPSFSVLLCFLVLSGTPRANVGKTAKQDAEQKASPEMDRLKKLYLGSWDYTEHTQKRHSLRKAEATRVSTPASLDRVEIQLSTGSIRMVQWVILKDCW